LYRNKTYTPQCLCSLCSNDGTVITRCVFTALDNNCHSRKSTSSGFSRTVNLSYFLRTQRIHFASPSLTPVVTASVMVLLSTAENSRLRFSGLQWDNVHLIFRENRPVILDAIYRRHADNILTSDTYCSFY
jgi:hypothetical protein